MSKATIKQVAAAADVLTATISRALNETDYVSGTMDMVADSPVKR